MAQVFFRSFARNLIWTSLGAVLIGAANLALGATWPEVRVDIPEYVVLALFVAALLAAYDTWKASREPRAV